VQCLERHSLYSSGVSKNRNREARKNEGKKKFRVSKTQTGKAKHKGTKIGLYLRGLKNQKQGKPEKKVQKLGKPKKGTKKRFRVSKNTNWERQTQREKIRFISQGSQKT